MSIIWVILYEYFLESNSEAIFATESSNCVAIPDAMDSADDMSK